jgi:hypothetical protein
MSEEEGSSGVRVRYHGSWEEHVGKRVHYHGLTACIVHADLFRLVLETEEPARRRVAVEEYEWREVELVDPESEDTPGSEVG